MDSRVVVICLIIESPCLIQQSRACEVGTHGGSSRELGVGPTRVNVARSVPPRAERVTLGVLATPWHVRVPGYLRFKRISSRVSRRVSKQRRDQDRHRPDLNSAIRVFYT